MMGIRKDSDARDRIVEKAEELFYRQGYRATGINQIIEESGVAKATFYSHFPSKEDLCVAYLERVRDKEMALVRETMAKRRNALSRYMAPIEVLEQWLVETKFRGCPFINIASEVTEVTDPIRKVGENFYRAHTQLIMGIVRELKESDPTHYAHIDVTAVAERYMTIFVGAIGLCEIFHSIAPLRNSIAMVKELVHE